MATSKQKADKTPKPEVARPKGKYLVFDEYAVSHGTPSGRRG